MTGSAAIECAFVAAGLLRAARFQGPNVWDVGGGVALVRAAGLEARWPAARTAGRPLDRFEPPPARRGAGLRRWRRPGRDRRARGGGRALPGEPLAVERPHLHPLR